MQDRSTGRRHQTIFLMRGDRQGNPVFLRLEGEARRPLAARTLVRCPEGTPRISMVTRARQEVDLRRGTLLRLTLLAHNSGHLREILQIIVLPVPGHLNLSLLVLQLPRVHDRGLATESDVSKPPGRTSMTPEHSAMTTHLLLAPFAQQNGHIRPRASPIPSCMYTPAMTTCSRGCGRAALIVRACLHGCVSHWPAWFGPAISFFRRDDASF